MEIIRLTLHNSIYQKNNQETWYRPPHSPENIKWMKRGYHYKIVHKLEEEDYVAIRAMFCDLLDAVRNVNVMRHILFRDEACEQTNCRKWAVVQPNALQV